MTAELRVVVDTNVIVSQLLLPQSTPARATRLALRRGVLLSSSRHLEEILSVIMRSKFDTYLAPDVRLNEVRRLAEIVELVRPARRIRQSRDPKDDMLLEIAVNGRATHLVTGDRDLLVLDPFEGVRIMTPADFITLVEA